MERLIEILEEIQPGADYRTCTNLVDGHILDSLSILSLVAELEEEFDIIIPRWRLSRIISIPLKAFYALIVRLREEE